MTTFTAIGIGLACFLVGLFCGVLGAALCIAAGEADDELARFEKGNHFNA